MRSWASMLRTVRAPMAVLLLGVIGLLVPPQTQDMLAAIDDFWSTLAFNIALMLLAFAAWFWARALLAARFEVSDAPAPRAAMISPAPSGGKGAASPSINPIAFLWLPRLLFVAAALFAVAWLLVPLSLLRLLLVGAWTAIALYILKNRQRWPFLTNTRPSDASAGLKKSAPAGRKKSFWRDRIWQPLLRLLAYAPLSSRIGWGLLILGFVAFLVGAIESFLPQQFLPQDWPGIAALSARGFPGPSIAVLGLALMIGPLAAVTFVADGFHLQWRLLGGRIGPRRPPVILFLALWIFAFVPYFFEAHTVRIVEPSAAQAATFTDQAKRVGLKEMLTSWNKCRGAAGAGPLRPVIVAISGGATRAGLWGARVLQAVDEAAGEQHHVIFAVSSVSGGSLGAAAYLALQGAGADKEGCVTSVQAGKDAYRDAYLSLRKDAVGPLLAGRLLGDLPRTFVTPFAAPLRHMPPRGGDSAEAMERAFESLWRPTTKGLVGARSFSEAFLSLFYQGGSLRPGMPIWLANGTDAATGNRVVTVPFKPNDVADPNGLVDWPIRGARDALGLLEADVAISTAINNTARFPFLEPFGTLLKKDGTRTGALIDGGYFENEGLETALDLADWLKTRGSELLNRRIEPIIVVATGNGDHIDPGPLRCFQPADGPTTPSKGNVLQILAPLLGIYDVRSGHSTASLHQAREQYCSKERRSFFHFYLPRVAKKDVPLNWILSEDVADGLWDALLCERSNAVHPCDDPGNKKEFEELKKALAP
jgi:hypothetical protein